jgi:hypothetical protein
VRGFERVVVYFCVCVASDEIRYALAGGKVDRSQVIQCISLVEETGDGARGYLVGRVQQHSIAGKSDVRCLRAACGEPFMMMVMMMMPIFMHIGKKTTCYIYV